MPSIVFSLRQKVVVGVAAVYLLMASTIFGSYYFMRSLEQKIGYVEDISKMEEAVLEMRRFEKNYFLYGDEGSLVTARSHLARVERLLGKNLGKIEALSSLSRTADFKENLARYEQLLAECSELAAKQQRLLNPEVRAEHETRIRKTGSSIAEFAEAVANRKRESIKETVSVSINLSLLGMAVVGFGLFAIVSFLLARVTRSLRVLEEGAKKIAKGEFEPIESLPGEREIRDIFESFNTMAVRLRDREEQLVQSKKLASLGTMLAGVAHEVNNPLSNISSSCEILLEELAEADTEFQKSLLKKVLGQVEKARTIVLNLLEFSRSKEFQMENIDAKGVLEKAANLAQGQRPSSVRLILNVEDRLQIHADKQRLEQALVNLITNAFQAIDGTGEVQIRAMAASDGMVNISIRDTGKGIPKENLSRIFDPFFTTKDVDKGTGLGLFITHDIIVRHKGTIRVESLPGKGTVFCITLPAAEPMA